MAAWPLAWDDMGFFLVIFVREVGIHRVNEETIGRAEVLFVCTGTPTVPLAIHIYEGKNYADIVATCVNNSD